MKFRYLSGVTTLTYAPDKCRGCGKCSDVCPHGVFAFEENGKARLADKDACIECGACMKNCPFGALQVQAGVGCATAILNSRKGGNPTCGPTCGESKPATGGCGCS
ncbi:MAG: mercury methylation ferredoxin HgcB [Deltaproteobacteria bacterium]